MRNVRIRGNIFIETNFIMKASTDFVQVRITLKDCSVPVWRRVIVPTGFTLYDLHLVIQAVMDWTDSHLHGFFLGTTLYVDKQAEWEHKGIFDPVAFDIDGANSELRDFFEKNIFEVVRSP